MGYVLFLKIMWEYSQLHNPGSFYYPDLWGSTCSKSGATIKRRAEKRLTLKRLTIKRRAEKRRNYKK